MSSHPVDRRHRFLIGKHKGERRVPAGIKYYVSGEGMKQDTEARERWCRLARNTTKLCSCILCQNYSEKKAYFYKRHMEWELT
jgi:hypothetical protein